MHAGNFINITEVIEIEAHDIILDVTGTKYNNMEIENHINLMKSENNPYKKLLRPVNVDKFAEGLFSYLSEPDLPQWLTNTEGVEALECPSFLNEVKMADEFDFDCKYLRAMEFKKNLSWYHIMVNFDNWMNFIFFIRKTNEIHQDKYQSPIHFLPHSCLCDGTKNGLHLHRHLICVMPKEVANEAIGGQRWKNLRCKIAKKILATSHLINTIAYLGNEKSKSAEYKSLYNGQSKCFNGHFFIFKKVAPLFRFFCSLTVQNGIDSYLKSKSHDFYHTLQRDTENNNRWTVEYKEVLPRCVVFPLPKNMELEKPSGDNSHKCYIYAGKEKLHINKKDELCSLSDDNWRFYQLTHNNNFAANMGKQRYTFEQFCQRVYNNSQKVAEKMAQN